MSPAEHVNPQKIVQVATGFMAAKFLFTASEIGLFEALVNRPLSLDGIAERVRVPRRTARMVADAMVVLGFVERDGDHYRNSPVASAFLSGGGPADFRPFLRLLDRVIYRKWEHLGDSVRAGHGAAGRFQFDSTEEEEIFSRGVEALTAGDAHALPQTYDFSRHKRVLDLGGGTGSFLLPLVERYPSLECTLFELPAVARVARQRLAAEPHAGRIRIVEGDFSRDAIPQGHDACILAHLVHTQSVDHILGVLANLRKAMTPGARLLLVDFFTDSTHTNPPAAALLSGEFMVVSGEGDVYSEEEMSGWLKQTGWSALERKPLGDATSLLVAEAARK